MNDVIYQELKIVKGSELRMLVSDDIWEPQAFMHMAYQQAWNALKEIIHQTQHFYTNVRHQRKEIFEDALFQYTGNVIAFVGQRGAGKTRTMISFSHALADIKQRKDEDVLSGLADCQFLVMPPISPSALTKAQSFLYVVLSRVYRYVLQLLENSEAYICEDETVRQKLWEYFNNCLSGINGVTATDKKVIEDLSELQDMVDGISLRENFFHLVRYAIESIIKEGCAEKTFLVLQIDDADSQIEHGYTVLEDVRRYLLVPNILILMSSDIELLNSVILQNHLKQFPITGSQDFLQRELSRMCRKYIDKIIPPSHMIHLPRVEQCANNGTELHIKYVEESGKSALDWIKDTESWNLQEMLLMLVYYKTGIIFVSHKTQLNHIIPRSLRGLNQFIYLLSNMEDVPRIDSTSLLNSLSFARKIKQQYLTISKNLELFSNYFSYDWIDAKVRNVEDREFLHSLVETPRDNFVSCAQRYLRERYKNKSSFEIPVGNWTLHTLDKIIIDLESQPCSDDDYLLFFTIGTLRTISSHMTSWRIKYDTACQYIDSYSSSKDEVQASEKLEDEQRLLVFDFNPQKWGITYTYPVNKIAADTLLGIVPDSISVKLVTKNESSLRTKWGNSPSGLTDSSKIIHESIFIVPPVAAEVARNKKRSGIQNDINILNFITLFLRLGADELGVGNVTDQTLDRSAAQRILYQVQEAALNIALNWDVVARLCKHLRLPVSSADENTQPIFGENLEHVFSSLDNLLRELNGGHIVDCELVDRVVDSSVFANFHARLYQFDSDNPSADTWLGNLQNLRIYESNLFRTPQNRPVAKGKMDGNNSEKTPSQNVKQNTDPLNKAPSQIPE